MIFDRIENYTLYAGISDRLLAAFHFLLESDLHNQPAGRVEIDGDNLFAIVQEYATRPADQGVWEAHRRYIDVQFMLDGRERMGFANLSTMQLGEYVPEKDFQPMQGAGSTVEMFPGSFVVFFPEDGHMPGLTIQYPEKVRKVVVKVKLEES